MPYGLISLHGEIELFRKILEFYSKLHPKMKFSKKEKTLKQKEIGEVLYTYAGEEIEAFAAEKMSLIESALPGYSVPAIVLRKGRKLILLDGHRRLRVGWKKQIPWPALILVPDKDAKFGIEEAIIGKIKEMY